MLAPVDPYQTPENEAEVTFVQAKPRSRLRWALIGSGLGAAAPVLLGIYSLYAFHSYTATLPPGTPVCGSGVLGAYAMIVVVGPFCGAVGAVAGWIAAIVNWRISY